MHIEARFMDLVAHIEEDLSEDLTLHTLAARVGLSPFHFHRRYGAAFHESLHRQIKRMRLERSAFALLYCAESANTVAKASGYRTLSAFSHAFAAYFGVPPTRYAKTLRAGVLAEHRASLEARLGPVVSHLSPSDIVEVAARPIGFTRALAHVDGIVEGACEAHALLRDVVPGSREWIAVSADLLALAMGGVASVDAGVDADQVPVNARAQLGTRTLPADRCAVFEVRGPASRLPDILQAVYAFWLPRSGERPRAAPHFAIVDANSTREVLIARLYVPLAASGGQS